MSLSLNKTPLLIPDPQDVEQEIYNYIEWLKRHDLLYHFDDDATDCIGHKVSSKVLHRLDYNNTVLHDCYDIWSVIAESDKLKDLLELNP